MIRDFENKDMEQLLSIWLSASIEAHDFIPASFWQDKLGEMREVYVPNSQTFVFEVDQQLYGFISLLDNYIAALFVHPEKQGLGIGQELMAYIKERFKTLSLSVYSKNKKAIAFYEKQGFVVLLEQEEPHSKAMETQMSYTCDG